MPVTTNDPAASIAMRWLQRQFPGEDGDAVIFGLRVGLLATDIAERLLAAFDTNDPGDGLSAATLRQEGVEQVRLLRSVIDDAEVRLAKARGEQP